MHDKPEGQAAPTTDVTRAVTSEAGAADMSDLIARLTASDPAAAPDVADAIAAELEAGLAVPTSPESARPS